MYYFPLFLCTAHWGKPSNLSLLFSGTLHSNGYIFSFLLCFSLLFFSQLIVMPPQTATLLFCISFCWEEGNANQFHILALKTPWTVLKDQFIIVVYKLLLTQTFRSLLLSPRWPIKAATKEISYINKTNPKECSAGIYEEKKDGFLFNLRPRNIFLSNILQNIMTMKKILIL